MCRPGSSCWRTLRCRRPALVMEQSWRCTIPPAVPPGRSRGSAMSRLNDLAGRRRFDFSILTDMRCEVFDFTAHVNVADLNDRKHAITRVDDAVRVSKY